MKTSLRAVITFVLLLGAVRASAQRFGSGWLEIYFLICSCTFMCSAPWLCARDYTTLKYDPDRELA